MAKVTLYYTQGCHLCEEALSLALCCVREGDILHQDILESEALVEKYQTSIPVLKCITTGKLLYWPFTQQQIQELVQEDGFNKNS
ncbi:thiol-disulfide isomerase [Pseudoalteromonas luteoviolacea]|uniref:Thiol-disulfide isomerase n=1 Tax=Pseudoalteromonas luteoviolacea TaxID=43657 RepID=A0A1C0TUI5_9GAMM|nr:glutaredoxin family protein [Pseudoalteromonas luteoviolacea]OCQ22985.1 thiol-disulfide isomerase [Pseudoalteromonas luteoviolacea]